MKYIADTSVWINHLHKRDEKLSALLAERKVLSHEVTIGEIACGTFKKRGEVLGNLKMLPRAKDAEFNEILELIEQHRLYGIGLGLSDVRILASALLSGVGILTKDKAMLGAMKKLNIR